MGSNANLSPQARVRHIAMYGERLKPGMWVGVGSVCKRQGDPMVVEGILRAIKGEHPDLLLHGFGVKLTALRNIAVRMLLATADSLAWSFGARKRKRAGQQKRGGNDWREALKFRRQVHRITDPYEVIWDLV